MTTNYLPDPCPVLACRKDTFGNRCTSVTGLQFLLCPKCFRAYDRELNQIPSAAWTRLPGGQWERVETLEERRNRIANSRV